MTKKVLIIEDNFDIQEIYRFSFEDAWFEVMTSLDWLKWLVDLIENKPDLILLDIMMPEMNWFEVLKIIKEQSSISIPIIICSNLSSDEDEKKALDLGANLYIRKSDYEWSEVVEKVIKFLEKNKNI